VSSSFGTNHGSCFCGKMALVMADEMGRHAACEVNGVFHLHVQIRGHSPYRRWTWAATSQCGWRG
jgi:hypothetical protein